MGFHTSADIQLQLLLFTVTELQSWHVYPPYSARPYWRFYWNSTPGAEVEYNGDNYQITPDYLYIIPPGTGFNGILHQPLQHLNCNFVLSERLGTLNPGVYRIAADGEVGAEVRDLFALLLGNPGENEKIQINFHMHALVSYCLSRLSGEFSARRRYGSKVERVLQVIDAAVEADDLPLGNAELAEGCSMHCNSFVRLFKAEVGVSPQVYIMDKRISRSCMLLHDLSLDIEDVACRLGFCDRYHFSREFKKKLGIAPVQFRRSL